MRENILHLQIKIHGVAGYITRDIHVDASQTPLLGASPMVLSWATDKRYTEMVFQQTPLTQTPLLAEVDGPVIKPASAAMGISLEALNVSDLYQA